MTKKVIIDTNLLVLLIVGLTSVNYIKAHKRLQKYDETDFQKLIEITKSFSAVLVTPHVLAETSNLLAYVPEPSRTEIFQCFQHWNESHHEVLISSKIGARRSQFVRLGLTGSIILEVGLAKGERRKVHVLSDDLQLLIAAESIGLKGLNFNYRYDF